MIRFELVGNLNSMYRATFNVSRGLVPIFL